MKKINIFALWRASIFVCAVAILGSSNVLAQSEPAAPIGRLTAEQLLRMPDFRHAALSPNGRYIAGVIAESGGDVLIVHDRQSHTTASILGARRADLRSISFVSFKGDGRLFFGVEAMIHDSTSARRGQGNDIYMPAFYYYSADLDGKNVVLLFRPLCNTSCYSADLISSMPADSSSVLMLVPYLSRNELRKYNVQTGAFVTLDPGTDRTFDWVLDDHQNVVMRKEVVNGGRGYAWFRRPVGGRDWTEVARFVGEGGSNGAPDFKALGPGRSEGEVVVSARPNGRDTNGLYYYNVNDGTYGDTLYANDQYDVFDVMRAPNSDAIIGACYTAFKYRCEFADANITRIWRQLEEIVGAENEVSLLTGGNFGNALMVYVSGPQNFGAYYIYDTLAGTLDLFQRARRDISPSQLPGQQVYHYKSSDGSDLWGYLRLPPGATMETRNLPLIVYPHGGPESRDEWGMDEFATYWGAQGYAVFQPNFRGGSGFGRRFVEAGWGQWGRLIQADIRDGTKALTDVGIADPNRVCIAGWSFGGYAAYAASFLDGDIYKCAFVGAGISDLRTMLAWERQISGGQTSMSYRYWSRAMGERAQSETLDAYSAYRNIDRINMPLFIAHGLEDGIVPVEQTYMMVEALERAHKPYRQLLIPHMAHSANSFNAQEMLPVFAQSLEFLKANIREGWTPPAPPAPQTAPAPPAH